ncbi:MAG: 1-deoxy-D-xylulose-5-phosphate synthase [Muribaculaceae bacterium]|nr:1-deoxy-D-xylulose-5-phosphate synthase [Muribaculaceae bacterium]MEE1297351.1 1-deoxy-D-xylulose-5-phosphate synthase [Muribaculaceae bacterium]
MDNNYPLLSKIDTPEDLRKLPVADLPQVCSELRKFLIYSLSENPGHFASSMGAVEITVALHYVLNTPYDRIVWDVGHQAYSHKVLTGRRSVFNTSRKLNGISGFPNPEESEYDAFIAGHASNSISAGLGMAIASRINNDEKRRNVVAVIGDASIGGGLAFEGLNNASINKNNLLIILNDNDMAIDQSVGALGEYMAHINTSASYNKIRYKAYKLLRKLHLIDEKHKDIILRFNNSLKALLTNQQNIFEGLNIRYFGPFDGHDVERIVRVLNDIKDMEGPRILHLRTQKGKGFTAAETNPAVWHAPGKFDPETGERKESVKQNAPLKYQDVFGHSLVELANMNDKLVGVTAAMPSGTSMNIMQSAYPERTFDVGIAEGHAVTFSAGLAKDGLKPFCAIYSTFLQRAYDAIINDVAILNLPVTFCIDRAGLVGEDGVTHQGAFDLAYMRCVPNMTVAAPMNEHWLRNLMYTAQIKNCGPFSIRYPRGNGVLLDWKNEMKEVEIGKGVKLTEGDDIAILSIGHIGNIVADAVEGLKAQGMKVAHYDMVFLKPLDESILYETGSKYKAVITVEDGTVVGGLGTAVSEWYCEHGYNVKVRKIGIPDSFIPHGTVPQLYELCGMDNNSIKDVVLSLINN